TGADRFALVVQDHGGVAVETDRRAVLATDFLGGTHDDGLAHVALLHATARDGFLDRHHDDVADAGVAAVGTTQNLDALHPARAGVVSDIQIGLHLDHLVSPDLWEPPVFRGPRVSIELGMGIRPKPRSPPSSVSSSRWGRIPRCGPRRPP